MCRDVNIDVPILPAQRIQNKLSKWVRIVKIFTFDVYLLIEYKKNFWKFYLSLRKKSGMSQWSKPQVPMYTDRGLMRADVISDMAKLMMK